VAWVKRACLRQSELAVLLDQVLPQSWSPWHRDSQGAEGGQVQPVYAQGAHVLHGWQSPIDEGRGVPEWTLVSPSLSVTFVGGGVHICQNDFPFLQRAKSLM